MVAQLENLAWQTLKNALETYLEQELCMAVPDSCSCSTVKSKALDGHFKFVQLLGKIKRSNQHFVPATAFVWESSETFRSDPLKKLDVGDIADRLVDTSAEFCHAPFLQSNGRLLYESNLIATATMSTPCTPYSTEVVACSAG